MLAYEHDGVRYDEMPYHQSVIHKATPIIEMRPGWLELISDAGEFDDLPKNAINYVEFIAERLEIPIDIVSVGPGRKQTLMIGT